MSGGGLQNGADMSGSKFDSRVARFWDEESKDWGRKYAKRSSYYYRCRTFHEFFLEAGLGRASILDYGCGSGDITFPMLQAGHCVTGVDIARGMITKATERAQQAGLAATATYHHLDDINLSAIPSGRFDVVVCSSVLEYVDDDRSLLKMLRDLLRDGGFLLVSIPDRRSLYCKLDKWLYANKRLLPRFIPVEKLEYLDIQKRQYDIGQFIREMETSGFALSAKKHNTITLQRGAIMERFSNIPGIGMLAIMMFKKLARLPG
jgi:2-polyprenyl-3-methyl-5-hydroxy-6-metoxy-1,4-benzoquinol methylase